MRLVAAIDPERAQRVVVERVMSVTDDPLVVFVQLKTVRVHHLFDGLHVQRWRHFQLIVDPLLTCPALADLHHSRCQLLDFRRRWAKGCAGQELGRSLACPQNPHRATILGRECASQMWRRPKNTASAQIAAISAAIHVRLRFIGFDKKRGEEVAFKKPWRKPTFQSASGKYPSSFLVRLKFQSSNAGPVQLGRSEGRSPRPTSAVITDGKIREKPAGRNVSECYKPGVTEDTAHL